MGQRPHPFGSRTLTVTATVRGTTEHLDVPVSRNGYQTTAKQCSRWHSELAHARHASANSQTPLAQKGFAEFCKLRVAELLLDACKDFDLTVCSLPNIITCTSLQWRVDKPCSSARGYLDGAKIYLCYRRCGFLTWERRCCLLYRLSPRKSRF